MSDLDPRPASTPDRRDGRPRKPAWVVGGVLILVGLVFVVKNVTGLELHNWWALFILIPALGSLATSYQLYVRNGRRFTPAARGPLVGAAVLLAVTAIFLFDIPWDYAWPFLLIGAGAGVLLTAFGRRA
jgi:hypothetical protein